jgi:lysophospholipase L1-like esterase
VARVFEHQGVSYNGLDYDASLRALDAVMAARCVQGGGHFLPVGTMPFSPADFYDGVHMNPAGARKLGRYLAEAFVRQGIPL